MNTTENEMKEFVLSHAAKLQTEKAAPPISFESSGEFTLPDYMEPMQKVLRLSTKVLMPTVAQAGGQMQMQGSELHSLIYVGQSGEVCATVLPTDYRLTAPGESAPEAFAVDLAETNTTYRLLGPRKISLRAKSAAQVRAYPTEDLSPKIAVGDHGDSVCCLEKSVRGRKRRYYDAIEVNVDERVDAPQGAKPVWCDATAAVTDIRVQDGNAEIRGDVYAKVLFANGAHAEMIEKKIRFDTALPLAGDGASGAFAAAQVQSTEVSEESGGYMLDAVVQLRVCAETTEEISLCTDVFSTFAPVETQTAKISAVEPLFLRQGVFSVTGSAPVGTLADAVRILDTAGEAKIESTAFENGRIRVRGHGEMQAIYETENGYGCGNFSLPFELSFDGAAGDDGACGADAEIVSARTRVDGDRLICDMEVAVTVFAERRREENAVVSVTLREDTPYEKAKHPLCIVYPKDGQSLWSLAKEYRTAPEEIQTENRLSPLPPDAPRTWDSPLLLLYK